ncbi:MAG: undecaprenyl-diphosphate phosphatase [Candidatus Nealsonbacteria bacterium]|nr:undecaprenyl-diphosphate phosphatase [Candidatus Nealsonbacteria bacterium]
MIWLEILVLATVQGITEFLPISSSGHLAVGEEAFKQLFGFPIEEKLTVHIVLHGGSLAAILVFYWQQIWRLLGEDRRVIGLILVGSIPAAFAGLVLKKYFEAVLVSPLVAGCMFPITGIMLLWAARRKPGETDYLELGYGQALVIGVFQAVAILPGISRSGSTIVAGLALGLKREQAATFSFLLVIPAIGGAMLLEILDNPTRDVAVGPLFAGAVVSFVVGLLALRWLVLWLKQGRLDLFAWWVIPLGVVVVAWQLWPLLPFIQLFLRFLLGN